MCKSSGSRVEPRLPVRTDERSEILDTYVYCNIVYNRVTNDLFRKNEECFGGGLNTSVIIIMTRYATRTNNCVFSIIQNAQFSQPTA